MPLFIFLLFAVLISSSGPLALDAHAADSSALHVSRSHAGINNKASSRQYAEQSGAIRLTETKRNAGSPAIAWKNGVFIIAWHDKREEIDQVYFTLVDGSGNKLLEDTLVSEHDDDFGSHSASLHLDNGTFSIAYFHKGMVYKATFTYSGERLSSGLLFAADDMLSCRVKPLGSNFALSWTERYDKRTRVNFGMLGPDSLILEDSARTALSSGTTWVSSSRLAMVAGRAGVAWVDNPTGIYQIYLSLFDGSGQQAVAPVQISNSSEKAYSPYLSSDGDGFSLAWFDERDGNPEIYFSTYDIGSVGTERRITEAAEGSFHPVLAWTGSEWGLVWYDYRDGNSEIYFTRLAEDGTKLEADKRLTRDDQGSHTPNMVWADDKFGIVWLDERQDDNFEVYFMTLYP